MKQLADISLFESIQNAQPMLARKLDSVEEMTYPAYVSEKLDGMRCIIDKNGMWTRTEHSLKPGMMEQFKPLVDLAREKGVVFDGEMYYPHHNDFGGFMSTMAANPEELQKKGVRFHLFDVVPEEEWEGKSTEKFSDRYNKYQQYAKEADPDQNYMVPVLQTLVNTPEEAQKIFDDIVAQQGEGIMLRSPDAPYEHKRSKKLWKLKNWDSCEGIVTAIRRKKCPIKEADEVVDGVGYKDVAGSVTVQILPDQPLPPLEQKCQFIEGDKGLAMSKEFWKNREDIIGKTVEFQYLRGTELGRHARIFRMRPDKDVSEPTTEEPRDDGPFTFEPNEDVSVSIDAPLTSPLPYEIADTSDKWSFKEYPKNDWAIADFINKMKEGSPMQFFTKESDNPLPYEVNKDIPNDVEIS